MSQPDPLSPIQLPAADGATVTFYPHGAHVTSWTTPDGRERLYLSPRTDLREGAPIRGGIPVCWPQFSRRGPLPPHGFARFMPWTVINTHADPSGPAAAHLQLLANDATRALWPHDFQLDLHISVGGPHLSVTLDVTNTGDQDFDFMMALHTYFRVSDIGAVTVTGMQGLDYEEFEVDYHHAAADLRITGEVDRIYWNAPGPITLHDGGETLHVSAEGCPDAVIWNPGPEKSAAMTELAPDSYHHFLCIESAVIGQAVTVAPGARWRGTQHLAAGTE